LESNGRWGVFEAGLVGTGATAAIRHPTLPRHWYVALEWPNSVVQVWKEDPADEPVRVVDFFFPNPLTPWQFLAFVNGGPI